jgi:hypothetical protein
MHDSSSDQLSKVFSFIISSKGPLIEQYLAEEAIGLATSLGWEIVRGPFWNSTGLNGNIIYKNKVTCKNDNVYILEDNIN